MCSHCPRLPEFVDERVASVHDCTATFQEEGSLQNNDKGHVLPVYTSAEVCQPKSRHALGSQRPACSTCPRASFALYTVRGKQDCRQTQHQDHQMRCTHLSVNEGCQTAQAISHNSVDELARWDYRPLQQISSWRIHAESLQLHATCKVMSMTTRVHTTAMSVPSPPRPFVDSTAKDDDVSDDDEDDCNNNKNDKHVDADAKQCERIFDGSDSHRSFEIMIVRLIAATATTSAAAALLIALALCKMEAASGQPQEPCASASAFAEACSHVHITCSGNQRPACSTCPQVAWLA